MYNLSDSKNSISAYLQYRGAIYLAKGFANPIESPITSLIRGICSSIPRESIAATRARIFCDYAPLAICAGMVKVVGKRVTRIGAGELQSNLACFGGPVIEVTPPAVESFLYPGFGIPRIIPSETIPQALNLLKEKATGRTKVAAILTGAGGELLSFSWSRGDLDRTAHAELQMIHTLHSEGHEKFPINSTLWVSLRPCAMCAALILAFSELGNPMRVRFLEEDHGPAARNSALFEGSATWKALGEPKLDIGPFTADPKLSHLISNKNR